MKDVLHSNWAEFHRLFMWGVSLQQAQHKVTKDKKQYNENIAKMNLAPGTICQKLPLCYLCLNI